MKRKSLWRISVTTTPEAEDAVTDMLSALLGQPAVAYFNCRSGLSTITVYLSEKVNSPGSVRRRIAAGLKRIKGTGLLTGSGKIAICRLRPENWAESWKRHFRPIEVRFKHRKDDLCESRSRRRRPGTPATRPSKQMEKSLLIKPSWSQRKARAGQAVVVLDPGLSFGTGHHPTTAFCLRQIVRTAREHARSLGKKSFLDLGTGSGILAIAAAKLGYRPIEALDSDPHAVEVARANARANRVRQRLKIVSGDVTELPGCPRRPGQRYDLVCANLIFDVLIAERERITAQLKAGGTLVLAGILKSEFGQIRAAYESLHLKMTSCRSEREWCSGTFRAAGINL